MEFEALLRSLSVHESDEIRGRVARNRLLPMSALTALCADPVPWIRLAATANPRCESEIVGQILTAASESDNPDLVRFAASHLSCPPAILARLSTHEDVNVRCAVACNEQTTPSVLSALLNDAERVAVGVATNPRVPLDVAHAPQAVREAAASSPVAPEEVLLALAEDEQTRDWVACNPAASPAVLKKVLAKSGRLGRLVALANPACTPQLLKKYAKKPRLHEPIARNANTPPDTLRSLLETGDGLVLSALAENPSCPADVLTTLSKNRPLHYQIAQNPGASVALLVTMSKSRDDSVKHAVAKNPSCPEPLLIQLSQSKEDTVLRGVAANPHVPVREIPRLVQAGMWRLLEHAHCPEQAFQIPPGDERHAACLARLTPLVSQLMELVEHADPTVRNGVAHNPRCPISLLVRLLGDETEFMVHSVIEVLGSLSDAFPDRFDAPVPSSLPARPERVLPPIPETSPIDPAIRNRLFCIENTDVLFTKLGWGAPEEDAYLLVSHLEDARDLDDAMMVDQTFLDVAIGDAADRVRSGELQIAGMLFIHHLEAEELQADLAEDPEESAFFTAMDLEYHWTVLCAPDGALWIAFPDEVCPIELTWKDLVLGPPGV